MMTNSNPSLLGSTLPCGTSSLSRPGVSQSPSTLQGGQHNPYTHNKADGGV